VTPLAFKTASKQAKTKEDISTEVYDRAEKLMENEVLTIPQDSKPWRASDIKADCPRQIYYSRHEPGQRTGRKGASAIFGSVVHGMLQHGAPDDYGLWEYFWTKETGRLSIKSDLIDWQAQAKPFSLSAFQKLDPEGKVEALYKRYLELDRVNHQEFWKLRPYAIYRHPPTGRLAQEQVLRGQITGREIVTTADVILTDLYTAELIAADWKTGHPSEFTQLATYAIIAEQQYGMAEGDIPWGMFVLTGSGQCIAPRGKLPTHYEPDPDNMLFEGPLAPWRKTVVERVERLERREATGVWRPKLNPLCYRACEYRFKCPVGRALIQVREEKANVN